MIKTEYVKLYRGVGQRPQFYVPKVQERHAELEAQIQETQGLPFIEGFRKSLSILSEVNRLRQIASAQHFTDDEQVARDFAMKRPGGHVMVLEIPKSQADVHFNGTQHMAPRGVTRLANNFVFSAKEVLEHAQKKRLTIIEMATGNTL